MKALVAAATSFSAQSFATAANFSEPPGQGRLAGAEPVECLF